MRSGKPTTDGSLRRPRPLRARAQASSLALLGLTLSACQVTPPPGATASEGPIEIVVAVPGAADAPAPAAPTRGATAPPAHAGTAARGARRAAAPGATLPQATDEAPSAKAARRRADRAADPAAAPAPAATFTSLDAATPTRDAAHGGGARALLPAVTPAAKERSVLLANYAPGDTRAPALLDEEGALLPQTRVLPTGESEFFQQLGPALLSAIINNDPERVLPYFMPVVVYQQLKDSKNPPRDWRYRLHAQLKRDVERYHRRLGRDRKRASYVGLKLNPAEAVWLEPGREYNKLPYYRLFGSRLEYRDAKGALRHLNLSALISWRGEWYIVHVDGLR